MQTIMLTKGQVALVDDADYAWLMLWKWKATWNKSTQSFYAYGVRDGVRCSMSRLILGLQRGDRRIADHIEPGETLNNQRKNLRVATRSQNNSNQRMSKNNTSGFKGVHWNEQKQRWAAEITLDYKKIRLGKFRTKEEAFAAYCAAAAEHHGEFARVA